jgi:putative ABC transport system permease protein
MLAIGEGANSEARQKIKELGSNNIIIRSVKPPKDTKTKQVRLAVYGLTRLDLRQIKSIPSVKKVIPTWEIKEDAWHFERDISARVVGTTPEYAEANNLKIIQGRFINEIDMEKRSPVAVIGASIKKSLFLTSNPIGKKIKIKGSYFTIIGLIGPKSLTGVTGKFSTEDINLDAYLPLSTTRTFFGEYRMQRSTGSRERSWVQFHRFIINVKDINKILNTSYIVDKILSSTHKKLDYETLIPLELLKQAEHTKKIFSIILSSIAAISLIVGGIGIMNIMLATVTERTKEIGVRRALGARRRDIIYQFLTESIILSISGGIMGIFLGVTIPKMVTKFTEMITIITPTSIFLSLFISAMVGISFGIYPARKAAFLNPTDALRYE